MIATIPKRLFLVWIGYTVPQYAYHSFGAYKTANREFDVELVTFSLEDLSRIYNGDFKTRYDRLLSDSMNIILQDDKQYSQLIHKTFRFILSHQEVFYGKEVRFIQLLSDIFRVQLVQKLGGIYVDCDTFPVKPFDEDLLKLRKFVVWRHYNNQLSTVGADNYFIGQEVETDGMHLQSEKLIQTDDKWWSSIEFLTRKKAFFECRLEYHPKASSKFYIEHFCDGCWKNNANGIIRTPRCFLDDVYKKVRQKQMNDD